MKKVDITTRELKEGMKVVVEREQIYASSGACKCKETTKIIAKINRGGNMTQVSFKGMFVPGTKALQSYTVQVDDACGFVYRFLGWRTSYTFIEVANN